jgi:hypothetical protein
MMGSRSLTHVLKHANVTTTLGIFLLKYYCSSLVVYRTLAELLHGEEVFEYSADYNPNPKDYKYKRFGGEGWGGGVIWPT